MVRKATQTKKTLIFFHTWISDEGLWQDPKHPIAHDSRLLLTGAVFANRKGQ